MQTTTSDGKTFHLSAQTAEDIEFIHALDMHSTHLRCAALTRAPAKSTFGFVNSGATLIIDPESQESQRADAGREALRAFGQLIRLGLGEAAQHGHIGTAPADPQAQEQLATSLVQLQVMLKALGDVVIKQEVVLKEMRSAHGDALKVETDIVAQGGAA